MIKITPALPEQEWERFETSDEAHLPAGGGVRRAGKDLAIWTYGTVEIKRESLPGLIAIANAALHDDDPRKITSASMGALREAAETISGEFGSKGRPLADRLSAIADVLQAYLRPTDASTTY